MGGPREKKKSMKSLTLRSSRIGLLILTLLLLLCVVRKEWQWAGLLKDTTKDLKEGEGWDARMKALGEMVLKDDVKDDVRVCDVLPGCPSMPPDLCEYVEEEEEEEVMWFP